ncbi:hypothetical protein ABVT39_014105 [Epinephelus coioides]
MCLLLLSMIISFVFKEMEVAVQPESAADLSKYIIMLVHQHCCLPGYFTVLWTVAMMILCALTPEPAYSLKITSDNNYYYGASDESVSLNCQFTLDSEDVENLDIEWNIVPPIRQEDDKLILRYSQSTIHNNLYAPLKNRIYFTSPEPQDGDASLSITDLRRKDSGTYQCKVRNLAREQITYIFLIVMERPDKPVCYMDGEAVLDTNITLRCRSSQGTPPLKYRWKKQSGNRMLPPDAFVDARRGDLYLDQITERDSGTYRCKVRNRVGMEDCELILKITSPSTVTDGHGPTAGTTAEITAGVGMEDCEPVLHITSPPTVIDGHGPTAGTTVGAIVAVIVVITVTLTPVIYYRLRKRHGRLRRNPWAQRNSCINRPIRIEQLRCEEEDNLYEVMKTINPIEKSEDNGSMGNRDQVDTEGPEPCSLHTENEIDVEGQEPCSLHTEDEIDVEGQEPCSLHTEDEIDVEGQEPCSLYTEDEIDVEGQEPCSLYTEDEIDVEGQEPCSLHTEDEIDVEGQILEGYYQWICPDYINVNVDDDGIFFSGLKCSSSEDSGEERSDRAPKRGREDADDGETGAEQDLAAFLQAFPPNLTGQPPTKKQRADAGFPTDTVFYDSVNPLLCEVK